MPYKFTFDLSKVPQLFFAELATISYQKGMHHRLINNLRKINRKFKIQEVTGLNLSEALALLEDLIDLQAINALEREKFLLTNKRALFLPHCSRKHMDSHFCKANFDSNVPSFTCAHCSLDCQISRACNLAKKKGYDVYLLAGGSCIPKIVREHKYQGIIGIACGDEIKMLGPLLNSMNVSYQAIPLIKNGCTSTVFNLEALQKVF